MILQNGIVRTLDPSLPDARALAIAGDRIAGAVGVHETALASPETVDLGGRCVLPGFTDSHVHFPTWAIAQNEVRLDGCASLDEALGAVREAAASLPQGRWLRGHGWRSADWPGGREPTKEDLDAITGPRPASLIAKDYHSLWLNSAALALAGGDLDVKGGIVERDAHGEPTGVLREEAAWRFEDRHVTIPADEYVEAMRLGVKLASSRGVTCVHDKDGWVGAAGLWQRLDEHAGLTLRVWQSVPHEKLPELRSLELRSGIGSALLRIGYLKVFMDGTLGSQTAWMLDGSGVQITSGEELAEIVRAGAEAGWPVAVHAIGDRANREALDAFEQTRDLWQPLGLRPRIEHAQCVAPEDLPRFAEIGVAVSAQFTHAPSDRDLAERFWAGRLDGTYAFRTLLDSGAHLANGSDAPIEELDPWAGVLAGVLRTLDDRPSWRPEEALTLQQALHATCVAPAWLSHDERVRGTLLPGRFADLVVLDRDPFACEPAELREVQVVATMLGGRWVHNPPPWH
ncbi:MAG TPA: amidohydrolase [Gaiellaceae bacterium]|nr:amidohydrolase [Gaiellaceae bacterium]